MSKHNGIAIPLSAKRTDHYIPESLRPAEDGTGGEKELSFEIRIPTPSERDTIGARLFELGLVSVTQETIRATLVDELYRLDWTGSGLETEATPITVTGEMIRAGEAFVNANKKLPAGELASGLFTAMLGARAEKIAENEAIADEHAEFLDGYWSRQAVDEKVASDWLEREAERIRDEAGGAPAIAAEPQPQGTIKQREHARAKLLVDDVMERSQRLRSLAAKQLDYGRQNAQMMARLHILSMGAAGKGAVALAKSGVALEREPNGLITVDSIDALREYLGQRAWNELVGRIDQHFNLEESERKNSDSPLAKPSDQTGSHEQSGASASNDGSSTESDTERARTAA